MAKLWKSNNIDEWKQVFNTVSENINVKVSNTKSKRENHLIEDDRWMWNDLHQSIQGRDPPYITNKEISRIMRWKLTRGKFRPRLQQFAESNPNKLVIDTSKQAFEYLNDTNNNNLESSNLFYDLKLLRKSINELSKLKGIGPATSSLILSTYQQIIPFMADESLIASGCPLRYDVSTYIKFADTLQKRCIELNDHKKIKLTNNQNQNQNINNNNNDEFVDEKQLETSQNSSDNDDDDLEITPFIMSQCLWSYTISQKYGILDKENAKMKTKANSGNDESTKSKSQSNKTIGRKRKTMEQEDGGTKTKTKPEKTKGKRTGKTKENNIVGTDDNFKENDLLSVKPPKKKRKTNTKN